ncbi:MAG: inositol monophosphatase family protein, partial [Myxococcota bacterium]
MGRYDRELSAGIEAVRAAARVCRAVAQRLVTADTHEKKDQSPVTVADFASQAVVCQRLERAFPGDPVVGEEDASELRGAASALRATVQ